MERPSSIRSALILARSNGVGLDRDSALLSEVLAEAGARILAPAPRSPAALLSAATRADVALHLERVSPWWRWKARTHILIPNQERFPVRLLKRLRMIDQVWCKSRHAQEIFSQHHPSVHFVGFTSEDRMLPEVVPDYGRFFHLAGRSTLKNTSLLLDLWKRHPEWPVLTLVQHPENAPRAVPANVELRAEYLDDHQLRLLQNRCGIHLCPSLSEGWGHYIVEAMSCRAVTVTTDGPPMNELIHPHHGVLVPVERSEPRHLGTNFHVDPAALESAIQRCIDQPPEEKAAIGGRAREAFLSNHIGFESRVLGLVAGLQGGS